MSSIQRICSVEDCTKKVNALNFCAMHRWRFKKYGDPNYPVAIREYRSDKSTKKKPEYAIWRAMKDRCLRPNDKSYKNYGARGITVCERWLHSFNNFIEDMGERPSPKHSLDRRDNDGDYSPKNCRWVTGDIQGFNRRKLPSKSGITGVRKDWNRWVVSFGGKSIGRFDTLEEAIQCRKNAVNEFLSSI